MVADRKVGETSSAEPSPFGELRAGSAGLDSVMLAICYLVVLTQNIADTDNRFYLFRAQSCE